MEFISNFINNFINVVSGILYQPWCVPLILLAGGITLTIRSKFIQVRLFTECFKVITEKPTTEGGISSFGALMVSTASRVGTGNIIGVATAICAGGAGAVFWMWITAIIGGASAFVESTLAQIYKKRNADGTSYGGSAFYMKDALKKRWLGVLFSFLIILTYAVGYNMLAAYNLQDTFSVFDFYVKDTTPVIIGGILAVLFGIIVIGGAKRLTKSTEIMVPFMGIIYVIVSLVVLVLNADRLGEMFAMIFKNAFDFKAIFGGFAGSCIMNGIKRGLYSNEAGMGSAPNAAATADVSHPAKQGLVPILLLYSLRLAFSDGNIDIGFFPQVILKIKLGVIKNISAVVKPVVENKAPCLFYILVQRGNIRPFGNPEYGILCFRDIQGLHTGWGKVFALDHRSKEVIKLITHSFGVHPQSDLTEAGSTEFRVVLLADAGEIFPHPVGTILTDINFAFGFQDISDRCESRKIFYFWFHNKFRSFQLFIHRWCNSEFSGEGTGES